MEITLADQFADDIKRPARRGDIIHVGPIALLAHQVTDGKVMTVGLQLAEPDVEVPEDWRGRLKAAWRRLTTLLG